MNDLNILFFPILSTNRLILRKMEEDDQDAIFELRSNPSVNQFINRTIQTSIDEAQYFIEYINNGIIENKWIYWAITLKDNTNVIGTVCLWNFSMDKRLAELGYELNPAYQGLGIMQEAIEAVINFAFTTIKLKEIAAYTHQDNISSIKLLIKNGFVLNINTLDSKNENHIVYSLILSDSGLG